MGATIVVSIVNWILRMLLESAYGSRRRTTFVEISRY